MYKSIQAEPWIADPAHARLDPSNYLYFPLYGALGPAARRARHPARRAVEAVRLSQRLLGEPGCRRCLCLRPSPDRQRAGAALAALFHLGCGFVLLLAVINEDIMPGYTLVLVAMLLAGLWFDRPTAARVVAGRRAVHPGLAGRMAADLPDPAGAGAGARASRRAAPARRAGADRRCCSSRSSPSSGIVQLALGGPQRRGRACTTCCGPAKASTAAGPASPGARPG